MIARQHVLPNGPAAAAILASGLGSLALGLFTVLGEAVGPMKNLLNLYDPVGALSGKTTIAVAVWLGAWALLHALWKNRQVDFDRMFVAALVLITLGLLGTFPPVFGLFGQ